MEKLLLKCAEQIDGIDEASLMDLWEKYATLTYKFAPTKEWELATIVLCMIQAKHMKNQLFNHHWSKFQQSAEPASGAGNPNPKPGHTSSQKQQDKKACRILKFALRKPAQDQN